MPTSSYSRAAGAHPVDEPGEDAAGPLPLVLGEPPGAEVEAAPLLVEQPLQLGQVGFRRRCRRDLVHERAEGGRDLLAVAGADVLQQRADLAAQERVDARRADRHRPVGVGDRAVVGERREAPPLRRDRRRARRPRPAGPARPAAAVRRSASVSGSHTAARSSATSAPRCTPRSCGVSGRSPSIGSSSSRKREGCSSSPTDRGDHEPLPGPGDGDVEQPAFLGELHRHRRAAGRVAAGQHVDEQFRAEQRAAPAQVGPAAFLHVGDADEVPLEALARVRGEDRRRRPAPGRRRPGCRRESAGRRGDRRTRGPTPAAAGR